MYRVRLTMRCYCNQAMEVHCNLTWASWREDQPAWFYAAWIQWFAASLLIVTTVNPPGLPTLRFLVRGHHSCTLGPQRCVLRSMCPAHCQLQLCDTLSYSSYFDSSSERNSSFLIWSRRYTPSIAIYIAHWFIQNFFIMSIVSEQ